MKEKITEYFNKQLKINPILAKIHEDTKGLNSNQIIEKYKDVIGVELQIQLTSNK